MTSRVAHTPDSAITTAIAEGVNGIFEGFTADKAVFADYAKSGIWSEEVLHFFTTLFNAWTAEGHTPAYIDAGANIGLTLVPFLRRGDLGPAYAIEADADNAELLRRNLAHNNVSDAVTVINAAVHDREATLQFEKSPDNFGDHRIKGDEQGEMNEAARHVVSVRAAPLDDLIDLSGHEGPVALKSDLQGAESAMLRGGAKTLARVDVALIEYWPYGMARLGEDETAFRAGLAGIFVEGALLWPHDPAADPDWKPLAEIFTEIDAIFSGGDTELHRTGCLNLALRKAAP